MVAMVEARFMTPQRRPIPADMLLVQERRRRLGLGPQSPSQSTHATGDADEIFATDEDRLVDEPQGAVTPTPVRGGVVLRKPISSLNLAHIGWSGPIDHGMLQAALVCQPVGGRDAHKYAALFGASSVAADGSAALEVTLDEGDLSLLTAAASSQAQHADALVRAARLPDRLVEADVTASDVVASVLDGYRRAALSCAWYEQLGVTPSAQSLRERDETAVTMLSTLRALLGER
jgi:hypothetical protein